MSVRHAGSRRKNNINMGREEMICVLQYAVWMIYLGMLSLQDVRTQKLNVSTLISAALGGMAVWIVGRPFSAMQLIGGVAVGGMLALCALCSRRKIAYGDAMVAAVGGVWLGFQTNLAELFLASLIAASAALILVLRKKKTRKDRMAFVPYIGLAHAVVTVSMIGGIFESLQ